MKHLKLECYEISPRILTCSGLHLCRATECMKFSRQIAAATRQTAWVAPEARELISNGFPLSFFRYSTEKFLV